MPVNQNGASASQTTSANEPSSFPNSADINEQNRPISRASDFTEYDDTPPTATEVPSLPVTPAKTPGKIAVTAGEHSRPGSAHTGNSRGNWSAATPHQRAYPSYAGSTGTTSNRPPTAGSRTHVPSLTAHAFHRPMSSQRLQAQRSQRSSGLSTATNPLARGQGDEVEDDRRTSETRPTTGRKMSGASRPISRGTDITELGPTAEEDIPEVPSLPNLPDLPDRATANASPGSEAPLHLGHDRSPNKRPDRLNIGSANNANISNAPLTPRSFRSSIMRSHRHSRTSLHGRGGHEKLPSDASTAQAKEATKDIVKSNLGKNYEYFPGNTTFCLGGRFQNTRERPINIATGIMILLPTALFLAFS
jgi:palmitoyltransferase ZDHHC9/14/18